MRRWLFSLLSLFLVLLAACTTSNGNASSSGNASSGNASSSGGTAKWSKAYLGKLTLTYARDFPKFSATVSMEVKISKEGMLTVGTAPPASYEGDEVKTVQGGQFRQSEKGTVTVSGGTGVTIIRGNQEYVAIENKTKIAGEQITYVWDEDKQTWIVGATAPFDLADPIKPPLEFDVNSAVIGQVGSEIGVTVPQAFGTATYKWVLGLVPVP